jgi:hypothetical protein
MSNNKNITIYRDIYNMNEPHYISVDEALERIRDGKSKEKVEAIRAILDKDRADSMKKQLPAVCFSGKFSKGRQDTGLIKHSGFIVLDFDDVDMDNYESIMSDIMNQEYVYSAWVSPRGNGMKVLVRIADGKRHREHFEALKEIFPNADKSGINESRVCFESYDPHIYINKDAKPFTTVKIVEYVENKSVVKEEYEVFRRLLTWLTNRRDSFVKGERNLFVFKLASSCCRFGLSEDSTVNLIMQEYPSTSDFTTKEYTTTIRSAFRANKSKHGTAKFEKEVLVDKVTRKEVDVQREFEESSDDRLQDVVYGMDMKEEGLRIFRRGYENIKGIGVQEIDTRWKPWKKETTLLMGWGNYGKSAFEKWYLVFRAILYSEKVGIFAPEDKREMFFHDLTEILLGQGLDAGSRNRSITEQEYCDAFDWISTHFFYIYPESLNPTPEYIKSKFLELIIKEGISWCVIDPFNQMTNDYSKVGNRDDKYLEVVLSDFNRFAMQNEVYFLIIAHPSGRPEKDAAGNWKCPDASQVAGGNMWNNKMFNILAYHRPFAQSDPQNPLCEFHSKKIKDQKVVGEKGQSDFELSRPKRRFVFLGRDPMEDAIKKVGLNFKIQYKQGTLL